MCKNKDKTRQPLIQIVIKFVVNIFRNKGDVTFKDKSLKDDSILNNDKKESK